MARHIYFKRHNSTVWHPFEGHVPDDLNQAWDKAAHISDGRDVAESRLETHELIDDGSESGPMRAVHTTWFAAGHSIQTASRYLGRVAVSQ